MSGYLKASLSDYSGEEKGFISASFFPHDRMEYDDAVEINYSDLPDSFSAPEHYHAKSKTWVIVVKGAMHFKINGESVRVGTGEFIVFEKGIHEEVVSVEPGTGNFTIHSPSIPGGDKVAV